MILKNGTIIDPVKNMMYVGDLVVGVPQETADSLSGGEQDVIDITGLYVAPGLVDTHVHFRDPGYTYKEDIFTGAEAAKAGGFTQVIQMANTNPRIDTVETLKYVLDKGSETGIGLHACANVTMNMEGRVLTDMRALKNAGALGFTDDGVPIMDPDVCLEAMKEVTRLDVPISFHEENPAFITNNGVNRGEASEYFNIGGSSREAEIDMIRRDIELAKRARDELIAAGEIPADHKGPKVVIQHISTKEGVDLVRDAKKRGLDVHAEATPHHFSLTEEAVIKHGTMAKMNPPLRCEEDRIAIIEGLRDGSIDMIATDHAPHADDEKAKPITEAPSGILGLETSLSLAIKELVNPGYLTYPQLLNRMSTAPCKLYCISGGTIETLNQDLVVFDPNENRTITSFRSKSNNSPFLGESLPGVIKYTICNGRIVYRG